MEAITRAELRERVRHSLNKRTARDASASGVLGDPAGTHPWPSNSFLNEKSDEALRLLNSECNLGHVQDIEVSVAATTEDGVQRVKLRTLTAETPDGQRLDFGDVHTVKRAYWEDSGGNLTPLTPLDREEYDRTRRQWETEDATTPRFYWQEGYDFYLLSGTDTTGTLHIMAGTGIFGWYTDTDTIWQLPNDYHSVAVDLTTQLVAESQQEDAEMMRYAVLYRARVWGVAGTADVGGIGRIKRWKRGQSAELQSSLYIRTGRVSVGRRG
jgi:hypothetical protein